MFFIGVAFKLNSAEPKHVAICTVFFSLFFSRNSCFNGFVINCKLHFDYVQELVIALQKYTFDFTTSKHVTVAMGATAKSPDGGDCPLLQKPTAEFRSQGKVKVIGTL